eukprot:scaffold1801_cov79-Skeletonema_menzelii.AAC.10
MPISSPMGSEPNSKSALRCRFQNGWDSVFKTKYILSEVASSVSVCGVDAIMTSLQPKKATEEECIYDAADEIIIFPSLLLSAQQVPPPCPCCLDGKPLLSGTGQYLALVSP